MRTIARLFVLIIFVIVLSACESGSNPPPASFGKWTWESGSNIGDQTGIYGTKGTAAPSNVPGGRTGAVSWIDSSGKLWLFGGQGFDSVGIGDLNDLWKYDPTTLEWTWVSGSNTAAQAGIYGTKGTADPANVPGARQVPVSWADSNGKLWLFGGYGLDSVGGHSYLNDLWQYDPASLEWTWISGSNTVAQVGIYGTKGTAAPANVPGGRTGAVSWVDSSGNLWLFGGFGLDSLGTQEFLNDLWKYDPTTLEWTWVSGSNTAPQPGIYGIKGMADPSNIPGARQLAVSWIDPSGNLWLFGGWGHDSVNRDYLNDLWKYDPTTLEWTWVSGSNTVAQAGIYGIKGTAAQANVPGARQWAISWIDSSGKLWLFGGSGYDSAGDSGWLNDLWKYDPTTLEWTWLSGNDLRNQVGTYGTKGTAATSNVPGGRVEAVSWVDSRGNLWLFGGAGYDSAGRDSALNDLWRYTR
jgi:N-acetylneuraminic acid mutarotase